MSQFMCKRKSYDYDSESSSSEENENFASVNVPSVKRFKLSTESENKNSSFSSALNQNFQKNKLHHIEIAQSNGGLSQRRPKRIPKCFSKNALMARENRLKKKMYIESLEKEVNVLKNENQKFNTVIENQSFFITELKNEIKYLKSVLANSADISKLVKSIHHNTGMLASSSLGDSSTLKNNYVPKFKPPVARKTAHPWEENTDYPNFPSPISNPSSVCNSNDEFPLPEHDDSLVNMSDFASLSDILEIDELNELPTFDEYKLSNSIPIEEHCYTQNNESAIGSVNEDDVGVCLHVSKHRVSLEFCSSCSESATDTWKRMDGTNIE